MSHKPAHDYILAQIYCCIFFVLMVAALLVAPFTGTLLTLFTFLMVTVCEGLAIWSTLFIDAPYTYSLAYQEWAAQERRRIRAAHPEEFAGEEPLTAHKQPLLYQWEPSPVKAHTEGRWQLEYSDPSLDAFYLTSPQFQPHPFKLPAPTLDHPAPSVFTADAHSQQLYAAQQKRNIRNQAINEYFNISVVRPPRYGKMELDDPYFTYQGIDGPETVTLREVVDYLKEAGNT